METELHPADWKRLAALRDRFLTDPSANYWNQPQDFELYDQVFAQRIGWKWEAALESLARRGWKPSSDRILDWGCGTGIAARTVAAWSGIRKVGLFDRSPGAVEVACRKLREQEISASFEQAPEKLQPGTLLLVSHVLSENPPTALERLTRSAEEVIWVEPGTHAISRRLGQVRDSLVRAGAKIVGPCTHLQPCPMFQPENERDWCHFFATPPNWIFHSAFWREVNTRLEIDLRSLPYSFLAATRNPDWQSNSPGKRLIGRAREFKAHCELLCCGAAGLEHRTIQKRHNPELFREIKKGRIPDELS